MRTNDKSQRRPGYSHPRSSRVTRGITSQVMSGTVTAVVMASLNTSGRPLSHGPETTTTPVIRSPRSFSGRRSFEQT
jgi:hypothetical protein